MEVGFTACKLGICAFIVPYMFCFAPSLLWIGDLGSIAMTIFTALIGATLLSYGLQRYVACFSQPINVPISGVLIVLSLLLIVPGTVTDLIGIAGGAVLLGLVWLNKKNRNVTV